MEHEAAMEEIGRLEAIVADDPGAPGFPALAEANRRAGRAKEAERVARDGLRFEPESWAGRVALALALLDLGRSEEARKELERVLEAIPDHPLVKELEERGALEPSAELDAVADDELDQAFAEAAPEVERMVDANDLAAAAVRSTEVDGPEVFPGAEPDSPYATETVAQLLEEQGHDHEAAALRERLEDETPPLHRRSSTLPPARRAHVVATLERWLRNLRRRME